MYYVDPDGNSVELQVDNFGDWGRSTDFMRSAPEFAADPIGTPIDPDAYLAAHEAGTSFEELHRRAYAGEFRPSGPIDLRLPQRCERGARRRVAPGTGARARLLGAVDLEHGPVVSETT